LGRDVPLFAQGGGSALPKARDFPSSTTACWNWRTNPRCRTAPLLVKKNWLVTSEEMNWRAKKSRAHFEGTLPRCDRKPRSSAGKKRHETRSWRRLRHCIAFEKKGKNRAREQGKQGHVRRPRSPGDSQKSAPLLLKKLLHQGKRSPEKTREVITTFSHANPLPLQKDRVPVSEEGEEESRHQCDEIKIFKENI